MRSRGPPCHFSVFVESHWNYDARKAYISWRVHQHYHQCHNIVIDVTTLSSISHVIKISRGGGNSIFSTLSSMSQHRDIVIDFTTLSSLSRVIKTGGGKSTFSTLSSMSQHCDIVIDFTTLSSISRVITMGWPTGWTLSGPHNNRCPNTS